ncbi:MAG: riboflavin synthase [Magnetococcales bacterium]|nr:riboflavin synthase [Magnetococcales bacterium]
MFTGLIEEVGNIASIRKGSADWKLTVRTAMALETVKVGDSIAVNGACLTVTEMGSGAFTVLVSAESVRRTTFGHRSHGDLVNLERAMQVGGRLDGHLVQGHVDAVGGVERVTQRGRSQEIWFRVPHGPGRYIVSKGSIAIDGVSLTVNEVRDVTEGTRFSVNIIPLTQKKTTLSGLGAGSKVNIETDLIGRYVERLLKTGAKCPPADRVDEAYLRRKGII